MSWSYNPGDLANSPKDQVRFLIGDVNEDDPLVQDEEIEFALDSHKWNIYLAAAMLCESLAATLSRLVDSRTGDVEDKFSQRAKAFAERAKELRREGSDKMLALAKPIAGGITISSKERNRSNPDLVKPFFSRDQFRGNF